MTDFLRLPHWEVQAIHGPAGGYRVNATYTEQPERCLRCGSIDELYRHGTILQALNDTAAVRCAATFGFFNWGMPPTDGTPAVGRSMVLHSASAFARRVARALGTLTDLSADFQWSRDWTMAAYGGLAHAGAAIRASTPGATTGSFAFLELEYRW